LAVEEGKFTFLSKAPADTLRLGEKIGRLAKPGDVVLLSGNLGAGKTCLTQGIARGIEATQPVQSPTFVLVREIEGRLPLYHIDLYRLSGLAEIENLGLDDYFNGSGLTVVEWADKGMELLPKDYLAVKIEILEKDGRLFEIIASGTRYRVMLEKLVTKC